MAKDAEDTKTATETKPTKRKTAAEIRQAQREKQKQERSGFDQTRNNAHSYLKQWAEDRDNWKFNSAKQRWIVQHIYIDSFVPADIFDIAVDYLAHSKGDALRTSMIDDAKLIIDPMLANNSSDAAKSRRSRALGMLPSHVTKGEAKANKKVRAQAQTPKLADPSTNAKTDDGKESKEDEDPAQAADQESGTVDVSESTCQRAKRIIKALSEQPKQEYEPRNSMSENDKRKRKDDDSDDSDDGDDSDESSSEEETPKKKSKKERKDKERRLKKEEKAKKKAEKAAKKERKKERKAKREEKTKAKREKKADRNH
ncbi:hypothetical protein IW140_000862 [Coemansia sp. RSA 1813]|nr:hypothetical protein EV178_001419 [Coemansia sp. RSA 1646]KAJ1771770.1 hypothetical protein LPJ74_002073 [Coemansia sp. RSA 1843]KAJ2093405.1 hypothetical protein IW138_000255 [Coemansia sp. RSA 986]KAJ2217212.1 hypothetical protein EV179_000679 [Coemansia sp. RSA 487]KAJ2572411.1 hypothetical protein IW140_000862 [Coemansia sp. RSA 1813]